MTRKLLLLVALTCPFLAAGARAADSGSVQGQIDTAVKDFLNESGNYETRIDKLIASSISKRFHFLDVSYLNPDDNNGSSGWKVNYDWSLKKHSGNGFEVVNQQAIVRNFSMALSLDGTYTYHDATNNEDYSKANFEFGIERGNFGSVEIQGGEAPTVEYQKCINPATSPIDINSPDFAKLADFCTAKYNMRDIVRGNGASTFWSLTGHGGIEGDQNYDLKNSTYGAAFYYSHSRWPSLGLTLDRVDPSANEQRKALVGDDAFDRVTAEIAYKGDLSGITNYPVWFFMSYRYFYELSAPAAIKNMDMDGFDYFSASLRFSASALSDFIQSDDTMLYIRYTNGQLPFDLKSDSAIEMGFSTNISALAGLFQR